MQDDITDGVRWVIDNRCNGSGAPAWVCQEADSALGRRNSRRVSFARLRSVGINVMRDIEGENRSFEGYFWPGVAPFRGGFGAIFAVAEPGSCTNTKP
jgi:hypothetical protein